MTRYFATDPTDVRLTVSAVVRNEAGGRDILLMKRSDNGCWGLPGGHVEPGESVTAATQREVREETGFRISVGRLIGVYSDPAQQVVELSDGSRLQQVNLCFEALALERGAPLTPEETLDQGFYPIDALPETFVPIHGVRIADAKRGERAAAVR